MWAVAVHINLAWSPLTQILFQELHLHLRWRVLSLIVFWADEETCFCNEGFRPQEWEAKKSIFRKVWRNDECAYWGWKGTSAQSMYHLLWQKTGAHFLSVAGTGSACIRKYCLVFLLPGLASSSAAQALIAKQILGFVWGFGFLLFSTLPSGDTNWDFST